MTSKQSKEPIVFELKKQPKTPHEEIMFCIESTNDIVSKILEKLERIIDVGYPELHEGCGE